MVTDYYYELLLHAINSDVPRNKYSHSKEVCTLYAKFTILNESTQNQLQYDNHSF